MAAGQELELYIHIPFCVKKCNYCDFLSMPAGEDIHRRYVDTLIEEIRCQSEFCREYEVSSVFVGGGTPSLLAGVQIWEIMEEVHRCFRLNPKAEVTLECNPGTLTEEKLSFYRTCGINRLSLGLQSANDGELAKLGRIHTYADFLESFDLARKKGFDNINVDLMSALPGQTPGDWAYTLHKVLGLRPEHISAYSLIVEEGTPFYEQYGEDELRRQRGEETYDLPTEEAERSMYEMTAAMLKDKGYLRYEISNYALPHKACRHNIGYWRLVPYLGLGLGSSSFMKDVRFSNTRNLYNYLSGRFLSLSQILADERRRLQETAGGGGRGEEDIEIIYLNKRQKMEEFMFLGLRMMEGVLRDSFQEKFGVTLESVYGFTLNKLQKEGLLEQHAGRVFLTEHGIDVSNYVFGEFIDG